MMRVTQARMRARWPLLVMEGCSQRCHMSPSRAANWASVGLGGAVDPAADRRRPLIEHPLGGGPFLAGDLPRSPRNGQLVAPLVDLAQHGGGVFPGRSGGVVLVLGQQPCQHPWRMLQYGQDPVADFGVGQVSEHGNPAHAGRAGAL